MSIFRADHCKYCALPKLIAFLFTYFHSKTASSDIVSIFPFRLNSLFKNMDLTIYVNFNVLSMSDILFKYWKISQNSFISVMLATGLRFLTQSSLASPFVSRSHSLNLWLSLKLLLILIKLYNSWCDTHNIQSSIISLIYLFFLVFWFWGLSLWIFFL